jgi:hypothetical protein
MAAAAVVAVAPVSNALAKNVCYGGGCASEAYVAHQRHAGRAETSACRDMYS